MCKTLLRPICFTVIVEDEHRLLHLCTIFLNVGWILNFDTRSIEQRDVCRLDIPLKGVDAVFFILASVENGNGLPNMFDNGVFLRTMRMKDVVVKIRSTSFEINVFSLSMNCLAVGTNDTQSSPFVAAFYKP